ncbi:DciA family protein [Alcaligenes endophyticus]
MSRPPAKPRSSLFQTSGTHAMGWLAADAHGAQVLETARQLQTAQTYVEQALPPALGRACQVARIDRQQMWLAVPSAAHAAKLRQLAPTVVRHMNQAGWNLTEVLVLVQAHLFVAATKESVRNIECLDEQALNAFEELLTHVQAGPLAAAIDRLLKNHRS